MAFTSSRPPKCSLRQLSPKSTRSRLVFALLGDRGTEIGRDPRCQIVLDPQLYGSVSRRHAEVKPMANQSGQFVGWQICDLDSANGTFVNGRRLQGCQVLQQGDRIALSRSGPEFQFECEDEASATRLESRPRGITPPTILTLTQLIPIVSTGRDLLHKAHLMPGIITVLFVVLMFASLGQATFFNIVLSTYLTGAAYYFVYQLCGKSKPWWVLAASAGATILVLRSPLLGGFVWLFRNFLPGTLPQGQVSFLTVLNSMFFGAGLMEELLKALPVFAAWLIGRNLRSPWRDRIGIWEPLDGILLGTASAAGFTLLETLGLYVPEVVQSVALHASTAQGELTGLQLLIPRVLGSVAGHMAYSGYFGYFIGLSVLKPSRSWRILAVGYLSSALLHALWNASATVSFWLLVLVGGLSYAFLVAAILKARMFSPKSRFRSGISKPNDDDQSQITL